MLRTTDFRNISAPKSYEEFLSVWGDYVKAIVKLQNWVLPQNVEDITQEILIDFYSKDYLNKYDPSKSKFNTFMANFTNIRLRGKRTQFNRLKSREVYCIDETREDFNESFISLLGSVSDTYDIEVKELINYIYKKLKKSRVTSQVNNYALLFKLIVKEMCKKEHNKKTSKLIDRKAIAAQLGMTTAGVGLMMNNLRFYLYNSLGVTA